MAFILRFICAFLLLLVLPCRGYSAISEEQFNRVLDRLYAIYAPMAEARNGNLVFYRNFIVGEVNSYALRNGGDWVVEVFGGSAGHPLMTEDAFALNVCHELGHHFGGHPKFERPNMGWASVEGQADYFATLSCMKKYFAAADNTKVISSMEIPSSVSGICERNFANKNAASLCKRSAMAGLALSKFDASNLQVTPPSFDVPFNYIALRTYPLQPPPQCRLLTYLSGAACPRSGENRLGDFVPQPCIRSLGDVDGVRPKCWFRP